MFVAHASDQLAQHGQFLLANELLLGIAQFTRAFLNMLFEFGIQFTNLFLGLLTSCHILNNSDYTGHLPMLKP